MRRDAFQAIADPTRREIIQLIARESMTPNMVAEKFEVSRQAVSKHIQILVACGILSMEKKGREHYCAVQPQKLEEVAAWLADFRKTWEARFERLDGLLEQMKKDLKPNPEL